MTDHSGAGTREDSCDACVAQSLILSYRDRIDEIDRQLIDLIRQRAKISAAVQSARVSTGGPRTCLAREMQIVAHFGESLGRFGAEFAHLMLRYCTKGITT